ncbi:MAG TPA: group III truncated hemoglobin [Bryobacteraceae bacterium]|jgi:hemoglobin|nr:group III truncated hemoglobin [Bryobacteraceae bacterium]
MYQSVNEDSIAEMVDTFYGAIRQDRVLGPIFDEAIGNEWTPHLAKMKRFWSSVLLASRTYKGNPMIAHLKLPRLTGTHFERWLALWRKTANSLCEKQTAEIFISRAEMIGARLLGAISQFHSSTAPEATEAMSV